jgi:hypothetical protein
MEGTDDILSLFLKNAYIDVRVQYRYRPYGHKALNPCVCTDNAPGLELLKSLA